MAASLTNFCCRSGGNNLNAGSVDGTTTEVATATKVTYTNGGWTSATDIFVAAAGADMTEAIVDRFASLSHDGDTSPTTNQFLIARITAVNAGTRSITLSTTARQLLGTEVATSATGRTLRIGGAHLGPSGATPWLDTFPGQALTNAAGGPVQVNLKNDQTYSITAVITWGSGDVAFVRGYTTTYGDGGKATIDGGTSGASFNLVSISASGPFVVFRDLIFSNNGASGSASGVAVAGSGSSFYNCVFHDFRGTGVSGSADSILVECEAYNCNQSNTANLGGFSVSGDYRRCIAHDNTGSNTCGFVVSAGSFVDCIADSNENDGFRSSSSTIGSTFINCDSYNNSAGDGIQTGAGPNYVENCNLVKNGRFGITVTAGGFAIVRNCGYGSGTQVNTSGDLNGNADETGAITYAADVTPWVDPANGDFRISLTAAKGTGRGTFTQTAASYAGTVAYPDVGAAQHQETASGSLMFPRSVNGGLV